MRHDNADQAAERYLQLIDSAGAPRALPIDRLVRVCARCGGGPATQVTDREPRIRTRVIGGRKLTTVEPREWATVCVDCGAPWDPTARGWRPVSGSRGVRRSLRRIRAGTGSERMESDVSDLVRLRRIFEPSPSGMSERRWAGMLVAYFAYLLSLGETTAERSALRAIGVGRDRAVAGAEAWSVAWVRHAAKRVRCVVEWRLGEERRHDAQRAALASFLAQPGPTARVGG